MRVLSISGCNLASLQGEFRIALDQPPFTRDGLFAIRGVTGAGKSTLIDAMCLALYDATPRFTGRGGPRVGLADMDEKDRISATDPKSVLRRGASQGWAEVVFKGVDGQRWRARWCVARARKRADGRLQDQEMALENLASRALITGHKREVLKAIQAQVGLTFEQFTRSVLLAQGDFAAFAKANGDERASLLEAMTGTTIYTALSMAAHERCALEQQKLRELQLRHQAFELLSDEAREAQETHVQQLMSLIAQRSQEQAEVRQALAWYELRVALVERVTLAVAECQDTETAVALAEPRRQTLAQVDAAQTLRPLRDRHLQALARLGDLEDQIRRHQDALPTAEAARAFAERDCHTWRTTMLEVQAKLDAAKPELSAARLLDGQIQALEPQVEDARRAVERHQEDAERAEANLQAALSEEQRQVNALHALSQELADTQSLQSLAQTWARVGQDVLAFGAARGALGPLLKRLEETQTALAQQAHGVQVFREACEACTASLEAQRVLVEDLERQLEGHPRSVVDDARRQSQHALDQARQAEMRFQKRMELLSEQQAWEAEAAAQRGIQDQAEAAFQQANADLRELEIALGEAQAALERAQAAMNLEAHRHQLVAGEPCPLCGSCEHPWATGSPLAGLLVEQKRHVQERQQRKRDLEQTGAAARTRLATAQQAEAKAQQLLSKQQVLAQEQDLLWLELARALDLPQGEDAASTLTAVRTRILDLEAQLDQLTQQEKALLHLEQQAEAARRSHRELEDKRRRLERDAAEGEGRRQHLERQQASLAQEIAHLEATVDEHRHTLAAFLDAPQLLALEHDPVALHADLDARISARQDAEIRMLELQRQREILARTLEGHRATAQAKGTVLADATQQAQGQAATLANLHAQRRALLDGKPVEAVESALEAERAASAEGEARARTAFQEADKALGLLHQALDTLRQQVDAVREALQAAESAFMEEVRAAWGDDLEALEACLAWSPSQVKEARDALNALLQAHAQALAVRDTHQEALDAHDQAGKPPLPKDALEAQAHTLEAVLDGLHQTLGGVQADLRRDDQARRDAGTFVDAIHAQEQTTGLWREMDALIGAKDGKVFRTFAQSLTLEALVGFANEQLARLNPRYRLQRVPGYDLELQVVDQDMGDEIRALNSLSGGETFLVSLALALGLSALSASDTPIESLFIDEGFGTLDAETLETALSVLDELQAQGRQVGIISHVEGLATHIPVQILVQKCGGGRSQVVLPAKV